MSTLLSYEGIEPRIAKDVYIAPTAAVIGDVHIEEGSSIWFGAVLRGDIMPIRVGAGTSIQDNCVLHTSKGKGETRVGAHCTVGHGAILHSCTIRDYVLVGMGAIVLDDATVGPWCIIGAGSLVTQNATFEEGTLLLGRPARAVRKINDLERQQIEGSAARYVANGQRYLKSVIPL